MRRIDDFIPQRRDAAVLEDEGARELGRLAVRKCRDEGLAQDSGLLSVARDREPGDVDTVDPVPDALSRLR